MWQYSELCKKSERHGSHDVKVPCFDQEVSGQKKSDINGSPGASKRRAQRDDAKSERIKLSPLPKPTEGRETRAKQS